MDKPSIASQCLALSGLFEAEVLVELMLRYWSHPFANDQEFRNQLLESAVECLQASVDGKLLMEDMPPDKMNLVAAIWYAEWTSIVGDGAESVGERQHWLETVKRSIPSCFCDPGTLT
jgi:hypothetical protein